MKTARYFIKKWHDHWVNNVLPAQKANNLLEEDAVESIILSGAYPRLTKDIFNSVLVLNSETEGVDGYNADYSMDDLVLESTRISVSASTKMFTFRCLCAPKVGQAYWVRSNNWYTLDKFRELCKKEELGEEF